MTDAKFIIIYRLLALLPQIWTLTIQKIDGPIFIYDHGIGRIQYQYYYYIHHFNIEALRLHIVDLRNKFEEIERNQFSEIIIQKFDDINDSLGKVIHSKRQKRWDAVGTVWKFIAGSPDANDLKLINSSINNLVYSNNKQVKINREMTLQLKETVFKTKQAIQLFRSKSSELHSINILFNLKDLNYKVENIIETIMLAKLGILNEKILTKTELEMLRKDLERENVTVHSSSEVVTYAKTSIVTNQREMLLFIKMPKLDFRIFRKVHIYPTFHSQRQIHATKKFFLIHRTAKFTVKTLESTIYNIEDTEVADSTCIPNLLDGKAAICNYTSNPIEKEVMPIDMQHILINSASNFTLSSDCGTTERTLSGSYLIQYENCTARIDNVSYTSKTRNIIGKPIHLPLDGIPISKHGDILNLSMEHLHKLQIEARKDLDLLRLNSNSLRFPHWSIFGGITIIPIVIGLAILSIFSHRTTKVKLHTTIPETIPNVKDHHGKTEAKEITHNFKKLTIADIMPLEVHH